MTQQPPWTPFGCAEIDISEFESKKAHERYVRLAKQDADPSHDAEFYRQTYRTLANDDHYINSRYQVSVRNSVADDGEGGTVEIVHLSIKRLDKAIIHDWRDMQRIKNELLGPECEAIELYPAMSRMVDTANQYHLWGVRSTTFRWPVGWDQGQVLMDSGNANTVDIGATQRQFDPTEEDTLAPDLKNYGAMWRKLRSALDRDHGMSADRVLDVMKELESGE